MKLETTKKSVVITIPLKQLEKLFGQTVISPIKMEEVKVEETSTDGNIQPEVTSDNPVVSPLGTEGGTPVQQ